MIKERIVLDEISKVKEFTNAVRVLDHSIDVGSGHYTVDGKSIMGILSLNLSGPILVTVHCDKTDEEHVLNVLKPFLS